MYFSFGGNPKKILKKMNFQRSDHYIFSGGALPMQKILFKALLWGILKSFFSSSIEYLCEHIFVEVPVIYKRNFETFLLLLICLIKQFVN